MVWGARRNTQRCQAAQRPQHHGRVLRLCTCVPSHARFLTSCKEGTQPGQRDVHRRKHVCRRLWRLHRCGGAVCGCAAPFQQSAVEPWCLHSAGLGGAEVMKMSTRQLRAECVRLPLPCTACRQPGCGP